MTPSADSSSPRRPPYVAVCGGSLFEEESARVAKEIGAALVAVSGEFGTLSEVAYALRLGIPVVGLNTWELRKNGQTSAAIVEAASPQGAVQTALGLAGA